MAFWPSKNPLTRVPLNDSTSTPLHPQPLQCLGLLFLTPVPIAFRVFLILTGSALVIHEAALCLSLEQQVY